MSNDRFDEEKNQFALSSMILGILSIVLSCTPLGIVSGTAGLILGVLTFSKKEGVKGMAIAGIVTSIIGASLGVVVVSIYYLNGIAFLY